MKTKVVHRYSFFPGRFPFSLGSQWQETRIEVGSFLARLHPGVLGKHLFLHVTIRCVVSFSCVVLESCSRPVRYRDETAVYSYIFPPQAESGRPCGQVARHSSRRVLFMFSEFAFFRTHALPSEDSRVDLGSAFPFHRVPNMYVDPYYVGIQICMQKGNKMKRM